MKDWIIKGNFLESESPDRFHIVENGFLPVTDGLCRGLFSVVPVQYQGLPVTDYD